MNKAELIVSLNELLGRASETNDDAASYGIVCLYTVLGALEGPELHLEHLMHICAILAQIFKEDIQNSYK